ncbi:MAG: metallophosphoesterase [Candidatus Bipolaricaulota bacterium]|nr:metallophosphoesterase [Candidatus Bipolaricaulota bacterium]MDW8127515.1 metallophosphoesterase [Candidatus Bipolaricaulota bacterium]
MPTIVFVADSHCGSRWGLTPPSWHGFRDALSELRVQAWNQYMLFAEEIQKVGKVDLVVAAGDLIDGGQTRAEGLGILTADYYEQARMAAEALAIWDAPFAICRGTPYHVTHGADWEDIVATELIRMGKEVQKVADHLELRYGPITVSVRHYASRARLPHTRTAPILKEWLEEVVAATEGARESSPRIIVRAHAHYYVAVDGGDWLAISLPALCVGGRYVRHIPLSVTHFGVVLLNVEKGGWGWEKYLRRCTSCPEVVEFPGWK